MKDIFEIIELSPIWKWSLLVIIGFPLAVLIMSESILRLRARFPRMSAAIRTLRNWVLPTTALYIFVTRVLSYSPDTFLAKTVLTMIFLAILNSSLTILNLAIFGRADESSWRSRVPDLLRDLVRSLIVLVGAGFTLSHVWGHDLGSIITALSVGSLVVGLALQETLGNLFAGVSLLIERPFVVGDFIQFGETRGYVTAVTWRSTQMRTLAGESIVIPNNVLAKESFRNLSRPVKQIQECIELGFSYDDPPQRVQALIKRMLMDTPGVLGDPEPVVWTKNYADWSIIYDVRFWVESVEKVNRVRNEVMTRIWYLAKREGLTIPYPIQVAHETIMPEPVSAPAWPAIANVLQDCAALSFVSLKILSAYESYFSWKKYAQGETVVREGDTWSELIIVAEGELVMSSNKNMTNVKIGSLELIGELCLNEGEKSDETVRAVVPTTVICFSVAGVRHLIKDHPELLRAFGDMIEARRKEARQRKNER